MDEACGSLDNQAFRLGKPRWPDSRLFGLDDHFSNHFGNEGIGLFLKSYAFPQDHALILSHSLYRYEVFKDEQRERLWEERRLARKTRPPDLDWRDMDFVTKCDRRAHGQEAQAMAPGLTGPGPSGQDGPDWREPFPPLLSSPGCQARRRHGPPAPADGPPG